MDFRLNDYVMIVERLLKAGYLTSGVHERLENPKPPEHHVVLRHDVDRRPGNALAMAKAEKVLGVTSTYYFRVVGSAYNPSIIEAIRDLGHEIGYHYEDFHLAKYDAKWAAELFERHLTLMRQWAPIHTIAMHGSPLSRFSNMKLWEFASFEQAGVRDCILSFDWSDYVFFTDTGRSFGASKTNLRDTIGGLSRSDVKSSADVANCLEMQRPAKVHLSTHPERWSNDMWLWSTQFAKDHAANTIKIGLRSLKRS